MARRAPGNADRYGTTRLAAKESEAALVSRLGAELGLPLATADELYKRVATCFGEFGFMPSQAGELCYVAVEAAEPNGKPIAACRRLQIVLRLTDPEDAEALRSEGLAGMRRRRLLRRERCSGAASAANRGRPRLSHLLIARDGEARPG